MDDSDRISKPDLSIKSGPKHLIVRILISLANIAALLIPILYAFSLVIHISILIGIAKTQNATPSAMVVIIEAFITLITGFLAICICAVKNQLLLMFAKNFGIAFICFCLGFVAISFMSETFFGIHLKDWFQAGLVFVPASIFYYLMIALRIRIVSRQD